MKKRVSLYRSFSVQLEAHFSLVLNGKSEDYARKSNSNDDEISCSRELSVLLLLNLIYVEARPRIFIQSLCGVINVKITETITCQACHYKTYKFYQVCGQITS